MKIRPMTFSDIDSICALWEKINVQPEAVVDDKHNFELMLKMNPTTCFVAEEKDELIGSIFGLFNGRRAWIHHLGIHPDWQKKNLGTTLLQHTEQSLKERGAKRVLLCVDVNNLKVTSFYGKNGYTEISDVITLGKSI